MAACGRCDGPVQNVAVVCEWIILLSAETGDQLTGRDAPADQQRTD